MQADLLLTHLDEIEPHAGDAGYLGKRLVCYPIGAMGYAHAIHVTLPAGKRLLPHWHDDRAAVFYVLEGSGRMYLDETVREAVPGLAMFQPVDAVHGFKAGDGGLVLMDIALFIDDVVVTRPPGAFAEADQHAVQPTGFGENRAFFPIQQYAGTPVLWVGERRVVPGGRLASADVDKTAEEIQLVLAGTGTVRLGASRKPLTTGSIQHLLPGISFEISNEGPIDLRMLIVSSPIGRRPAPPYYSRLMSGAPDVA